MTTSKIAFFPFRFLTALVTLAVSVSFPTTPAHLFLSQEAPLHYCCYRQQGQRGHENSQNPSFFQKVTVSSASSSFI